jgi:putative heme-binding domain-containing protein
LAALANGAQNTGVASRGSVLYQRLSCKSCHRISGSGGQVGPDLTAIGTTLSPERITEELLWPNRQIKEGYTTLQVLTSDGKIHQGYERRTRESQENGNVILQELATNRMITLKKQDIEVQQQAGSPMPMGLTSVLSEPQLLDLIQYLSELGKIK